MEKGGRWITHVFIAHSGYSNLFLYTRYYSRASLALFSQFFIRTMSTNQSSTVNSTLYCNLKTCTLISVLSFADEYVFVGFKFNARNVR